MTHKTTTVRIPLELHKAVTARIKRIVDKDGYTIMSLNQWIVEAMQQKLHMYYVMDRAQDKMDQAAQGVEFDLQ